MSYAIEKYYTKTDPLFWPKTSLTSPPIYGIIIE